MQRDRVAALDEEPGEIDSAFVLDALAPRLCVPKVCNWNISSPEIEPPWSPGALAKIGITNALIIAGG